jgi:hypothetical protein
VTTPLPIQPRPPMRGGLDSVATALPLSEDEWRAGVYVTHTDDSDVIVWDASCRVRGYEQGANIGNGDTPPEQTEKPAATPPLEVEFAPTMIVSQSQCHVGGSQSVIGDIIQANAQQALDRMQWRVMAQVLHGATPVRSAADHGDVQNPSLSGMASPVTGDPQYPAGFNPATPGDIKGTLQGLLDLVCECYHSDPVFHIPRSFMAYFLNDGIITWDESAGVFRFGPHLVSFDCYSNIGNDDIEAVSPTLTDGSEVWIWTSARPMVAFGSEDVITNLERRQNSYQALVERPAILAFDTSCFGAAKATIL